MKKLFSLVIVMVMLTSVFALVGCNGLWGFDDDDDVVPAASPNWSIKNKVILDDTSTIKSLRAAAESGYGKLVAKVYRISDNVQIEPTAGFAVADNGEVEVKFFADLNATYTIKITHPDKLSFYLERYVNKFDANKLPTDPVSDIGATSTLIAFVASSTKTDFSELVTKDVLGADVLDAMVLAKMDEFRQFIADSLTKTEPVSLPVKPIAVTGVKIEEGSSKSLLKDETFKLTATVSPSDATVASVTWLSDKETVATVDQNGNVTAVGGGVAKITVTTNSLRKTATCVVTVVVPVEKIELNNSNLVIDDGKSEQLVVAFTPADATVKTVSWSASPEGFVTVSNGLVSALKPTTSDITVTATTTDGNKIATCQITVRKMSVTGVSLVSTLSLGINGNHTFVPIFQPEYVSDRAVTWESSDSNVASVLDSGVVTGHNEGSAKIKVTTKDGGFTAECTVNVTPMTVSVNSIKIDPASIEIEQGRDTLPLKVVFDPSGSTNTAVTWTSSSESVAKVSATGVVTGVAVGSAQIIATTADGGKIAKCDVDVKERPPLILNKSVTTGTTTAMQIKISTVDDSFSTSVTLKDVAGTEWVFSVNPAISKIVPGVVLKLSTDQFKAIAEFQELKFTTPPPTGVRVSVTQEGIEVAFVEVQ